MIFGRTYFLHRIIYADLPAVKRNFRRYHHAVKPDFSNRTGKVPPFRRTIRFYEHYSKNVHFFPTLPPRPADVANMPVLIADGLWDTRFGTGNRGPGR